MFLTADWRHLALLNFVVDPSLLRPFMPRGVELDEWQGRTLVSLVGFCFLRTRVWGMSIPWHRDFEEINLRFYVRRKSVEGWRRGVVFVKEIVPRFAVAAVAHWLYNERYVVGAVRRTLDLEGGELRPGSRVGYDWRRRGSDYGFASRKAEAFDFPAADSEAAFIVEHYYGYTAQRNGGCMEYQVEHAPWRTAPLADVTLQGDFRTLYGADLGAALSVPPVSAFVAEGSPISVRRGVCIS